jgi:hypothetical protein
MISLIEKNLRKDGAWRDDERLVIFTEYKTTLIIFKSAVRTNTVMMDRSRSSTGTCR